MQHGRRDKNDVFVGNIPFGTTEEQLHEIFSEAGGIVSIRLVSDFETGKPKGFAFVEYEDAATALSAIRNLNGYDCNGRLLRVNFSNNSSLGAEQQRGEKAPQQERTVKGVVMQMGIYEVWDIVSNMKQLVEKEPDKAKQMFVSHPQVAEALLHMQVRLGMFKAEDVPSLFVKAEEDVTKKKPGAIMLGTGAILPQLVPPPGQFQQPPTNPTLGWGQAAQQPIQTQQVMTLRPPPPPPPQQLQQQPHQQQQQQQQQMPMLQPPQSQGGWGTAVNPKTEIKPRDPRGGRYNR